LIISNGFVCDSVEEWINLRFIDSFYIKSDFGRSEETKYQIIARTGHGDVEITGYFDTEEEAQKELDEAMGYKE
jgi:hypothetical protein